MAGTFDNDLSFTPTTPMPITPEPQQKNLIGKPLTLDSDHDDDEENIHKIHEEEEEEEEEEAFKLNEKNEIDDGSTVFGTFIVSSAIRNVSDFLIGPPQHNMQNADYIKLISNITHTECILDERTIRIIGKLRSVKDAHCKFTVLQKAYLGRNKTSVVTCLHYPEESGHYGLYFCDLKLYRHRRFVHIQPNHSEMSCNYVVLPIFPNPITNEYDRPVDLVLPNTQPYPPTIQPPPVSNQAMRRVPREEIQPIRRERMSVSDIRLPTAPPTPTSTVSEDRFQPPSWGGPRSFTSSFNTGNLDYLSSERLARAFTPSSSVCSEPLSMIQDFPTLRPSSPTISEPSSCSSPKTYRPSLSINKQKAKRVMRIVSQKSSQPSQGPSMSMLERVRAYNYNLIKNTLEKGLDAVRGFKGETTMKAKLGKVLWTNVSPVVTGKIWTMQDINDIVVKELGTMPRFTNITTMDQDIINSISSKDLFPSGHYSKTAFFEFHCSARNQPMLPYKPIVLHMNQGVIDVHKVVISEKKVAEVNWVSLDRKYDFQLNLTTKELVRPDVKPYTSFIKWVSICPITQLMSFENVPNFLEVNHIIFKSTTRYRTVFPFIVEVSRIEKVPMKPVKGSQKINAQPGHGEAWYDFEIINTLHDAPFRANLNLDIGCEAPWTIEDILQTKTNESAITAYARYILQLIEKIEKIIRKERLNLD
ncbi:uncharacterized protein B0P05DRAFT_559014 [Gilbertella persicaria]|uniref:uncharacterized protein n=1 Tax=Gilbertella persicaria TaxID=101096 RepID=UPI00221FA62F|nr:uncharacterized protein B0P05DRAFT_559014 [Gilbertella persicaria]KAI8059080.1 hypothetical protein B0P05DRAFT_559014 [Gilbertella persicaria]